MLNLWSVALCSDFQQGADAEDERLLPCGTAFEVKTLSSPAKNLLMVSLKQTNHILLQTNADGTGTYGAAAKPLLKTPCDALMKLGKELDGLAACDEVGRQYGELSR